MFEHDDPIDKAAARGIDAVRQGTHDIGPRRRTATIVVVRVHPRPPGTPCPRERRRRRAGLLARGSRPVRAAFSGRSEEHTSELQSLMRNSYAVFCLKKKQK